MEVVVMGGLLWLLLGGSCGFCIAGVLTQNEGLLYASGLCMCTALVGGVVQALARRGA